jgi:predicted amidohydrolase YtcJ
VPAFIRLYDGHSGLVNGPALAAAGIDGPRRFEQRARVVRDPDGRPTGHLVEFAAMSLLDPVLPRESAAVRRERLLALLRDMAATGLTGAHVMDLQEPDLLGLLADIEHDGDLPLRLRIPPWCMTSSRCSARTDGAGAPAACSSSWTAPSRAAPPGWSTHAGAVGEEDVAGSIAPGFRADLAAFAVDPVTAPADELGEAPVTLTMTGGTVVHRA